MIGSQLCNETITWEAAQTTAYVNVAIRNTGSTLVKIDNQTGQTQDLTVTFEFEVETDKWAPWYSASGTEVKFTATGSTCRIYGPFSGFPHFMQGRLKLVAGSAPGASVVTAVTLVELPV